MSEPKTYFDPYSKKTLPIPPLDDLRSYISMNDVDLPPERFNAAETWWFTIDHPGMSGGVEPEDAPDVAARLREIGFPERDIREAIVRLLTVTEDGLVEVGDGHLERAITNAFLRVIGRGERTDEVIEHYRRLVGALLEHTWLDHEGTEAAIADFNSSSDRAADVLRQVMALQKVAHEESGCAG